VRTVPCCAAYDSCVHMSALLTSVFIGLVLGFLFVSLHLHFCVLSSLLLCLCVILFPQYSLSHVS